MMNTPADRDRIQESEPARAAMQQGHDPNNSDDDLSLVELVNRVLDRGAVISGDITISVAGVDLVYVGLRVLLASVESMVARENRDRAT